MKNKIWLFGLVVLLSLIPIAVLAQNQPPVADAGADQNAYTGIAIALTGTATDADGNSIIEWGWALESAPIGGRWDLFNWDTPAPTFAGYVPGDYVLSLRVSDAYFQSAPDFVTVHVADNLPPVAAVTADKTSGPAPLTVCFDGSQSYDPEGGALIYDWDLGDGSNAQVAALCHTFVNAGTYMMAFGVGDVRGAWDFEILTIVANQVANQPPVASPTATPNTGDAPLTVQFTANASDPDNDLLTFAWDFGDPTSPDNTSNLSDPEHIYMNAGTYVVQLTVFDGNDDSAPYSLTITVEPGITLSVCTAKVKWWNAQKTMGAVSLWAGFDAEIPAGGDMVAIYFDNIQLFAAPFSKFKHGLLPGAYWLTKNSILVRFDFTNNQILVVTPKMNLVGLDNVNGVDVELMIGSDVAIENIMMKASHFNTLIYRSPGCLGEPQ